MARFRIDPDTDSTPILDRIVMAYGFTQKIQLAKHLQMTAGGLSARYNRGGLPADIMVKCMAETGATLEWLTTGEGQKFDGEDLDVIKMPRRKIVDGQLYDAGTYMLDKSSFLQGTPLPEKPLCIMEGACQFVVDEQFTEVYDGDWLVEVEGKNSVRALTLIPTKRVRVSGAGVAFDCGIDEITILGRVVLTIN